MLMMFLFRLITNILNLLLVASMSESMCSLHIIQLVLMFGTLKYPILFSKAPKMVRLNVEHVRVGNLVLGRRIP
jgi:hypothetical protein